MNFKKVLIAAVAVVVVIVLWQMLSRVDRKNPVAVATAFTNALKKNDTGAASKYYLPDKGDQWRQDTDNRLQTMRSNAMDMYFERIPANPEFTAPITVAGKTMILSGDKSYSLEMTQVDGKWYVAANQ